MVVALRVCVAMEALTARRSPSAVLLGVAGGQQAAPTNFVFNPKAGGMLVAEASVAAFPLARHAFMYRAAHKVVESFAGLMFASGVPLTMAVMWRLLGVRALKQAGKGKASPLVHQLPLSELSSAPVAFMTIRWLETISDWISVVARRAERLGGGDPLASSIAIRMDEFTSKDIKLRSRVVRAALAHFGVIGQSTSDDADDEIAPALQVFSVHSQAGSHMSGPKAKIVSEADVRVIKRCVVGALAGKADVQDGGANILLQRSLGVQGSV